MRKHYLDNIRWITIVLVVLFHCFFYYNNIGTTTQKGIFPGLTTYTSSTAITFAGIFQYAVYPWFMELLFVIAGISTYYALQKRTTKQYRKERVHKLLVPSTLGVICFGWISGKILTDISMEESIDSTPVFVKAIIDIISGIGALWFCQLLFVISLVFLLIYKLEKKVDANGKFRSFCAKWNVLGILLLYFPILAFSQIANMPVITSYRAGVYFLAFLLGYYVFSNDSIEAVCEKWAWLFAVLALAAGCYYVIRAYGSFYADIELLKTWYSSLFGYLMVPACLGLGKRYINSTGRFCTFASKYSFGIYVTHITVLVLTAYVIMPLEMPIICRYLIMMFSGFFFSTLLSVIIPKIPIIRYIILGI